jgi:hypothetical protein
MYVGVENLGSSMLLKENHVYITSISFSCFCGRLLYFANKSVAHCAIFSINRTVIEQSNKTAAQKINVFLLRNV